MLFLTLSQSFKLSWAWILIWGPHTFKSMTFKYNLDYLFVFIQLSLFYFCSTPPVSQSIYLWQHPLPILPPNLPKWSHLPEIKMIIKPGKHVNYGYIIAKLAFSCKKSIPATLSKVAKRTLAGPLASVSRLNNFLLIRLFLVSLMGFQKFFLFWVGGII